MVIAFAATGFLIDAAVQLNQITGQKIIFDISQEARSRVNSIYLTSMFPIGALGSVLGTACYDFGGWGVAAAVGAAIGGASMVVFVICDRPADHVATQAGSAART
jgi:predicted MFS family arabinose efflux permease